MTEARDEIRAAIAYYDARGLCWVSVVTYIGIKALFGGWWELCRSLRRPWVAPEGVPRSSRVNRKPASARGSEATEVVAR